MSSLENKKIKDSYKDLLQISNNNIGLDDVLRSVSDGEGTISALKLSSSKVSIDGNLEANSITINDKSVATQEWVNLNTNSSALINWTETNGNIIPNSNASFDLGNAEYKVRHLFLSDNSIWFGDDVKLESHAKKKRNKSKLPKWFAINTPSVTTDEILNWYNTEFNSESSILTFEEISLYALTEFAKIKTNNSELTSSDIYPSQYKKDGSINDIYDPLDYEYIIDDNQSFKVNSFLSNLNSSDAEERKQKILQIDETGDGIQFVDQELLKGEQGIPGIQGQVGPTGQKGESGIQGVAGPQGDIGPDGLKGEKGNIGEQGIAGPQGDIGPEGLQGIQGNKGEKGEPAPRGIDGTDGVDGEKGEKGEQGDAFLFSDFTTSQLESLAGEKGEQGISGPQGDIGLKGEQGIQGDKGDAGDKGEQGIQGDAFVYSDFTTSQLESLVGEKGEQGIPGLQGDIGLKGEQGIQGNTGQKGEQGIQGDKGDAGDKGEQGIPGLQGDIGLKGEQGIQGNTGQKGEQGIQGNAFVYSDFTTSQLESLVGEKGERGEQGIPGLQGDIGLKGEQGIQGNKGDSGDKGDQGIQGVGEKGEKGTDGQNGVGFLSGSESGDIYYSGGNIGIGTNSPDTRLHIQGSDFSSSSFTLYRTSATPGANNDPGILFLSDADVSGSRGMGAIYFKTSLDNNCYAKIRARTDDESGTSGRIEFSTDVDAITNATSPKMVLDSLGNLGIGTNSPVKPLEIHYNSGAIYSSGVSGNSLRLRNMKEDTTSSHCGIDLFAGVSTESGHNPLARIYAVRENNTDGKCALTFATRSTSSVAEAMRIDSSGNIGIGTDSPHSDYSLHIKPSLNAILAEGDVTIVRQGPTSQPDLLLRGMHENTSDLTTDYAKIAYINSSMTAGNLHPSCTFQIADKNKSTDATEFGPTMYMRLGAFRNDDPNSRSTSESLMQIQTSTPYIEGEKATRLRLTGEGKAYLGTLTKTATSSEFVSQLTLNDGNVGIGTDSPEGKLEIEHTGSWDNPSIHLKGQYPTIKFNDTNTNDADDWYIHVNANNFNITVDRNASGEDNPIDNADNVWETPHPFRLEGDTNKGYLFSKEIATVDQLGGGGIWAENASGAYYLNNVGIGTDNPVSGKLHIIGGNHYNEGITLSGRKNDGTALTTLRFFHDDENYAHIARGSTPSISISADGNIGIGTNSPEGKLEIEHTGTWNNPSIHLKGQYPTIKFNDINNEDDWYLYVNSNNFYILVDRNASGEDNPIDDADNQWETPHPLILEGDTNKGYLFSKEIATVDQLGGGGIWAENASGAYYLNNVGIGTDNPDASLSVVGQIQRSPTGNGVHLGHYTENNSSYGNMQLTGEDGGYIDFSKSGVDWKGRILYDNDANYMRFDTDGVEKMRILANGNIGIGATNPNLIGLQLGTALVVSSATGGEIVAHRSGSSVNVGDICGALLIANSDTDGIEDHFVGIWGKVSSTNGSQNLHFAAGRSGYEGDSPHLTIDSGGNVGIGTTNPSLAKLQIEGENDLLRLISTRSGAGGAEIALVQNSDSPANEDAHGMINFIGNDADDTNPLSKTFSSIRGITHDALNSKGRIGLFTRNGGAFEETLSIVAGDVGIGTKNPQFKFEIHDESDITMRIHRPNSGLTSNDTCGIGFSQRNDDAEPTGDTRAGIFSAYNGDLFLSARAGGNINSNPMDYSRLFIEASTGAVGIGTNAPGTNLHVIGSATIESSGPVLILKDTDGGDDVKQSGFISFRDNDNVERGWVGFGSSVNKDLLLNNNIGNIGVYYKGQFNLYDRGTSLNKFVIDSNGHSLLAGQQGTTGLGNGYAENNANSLASMQWKNNFDSDGQQRGGSLVLANNSTEWSAMYINKFNWTSSKDNRLIQFYLNGSSSGGGTITTNGTSISYNTTSDYRLKNNIQSIQNATNKVNLLKPITHEWNSDLTDGIFHGFLAHELQEVYPEAVTGEKDEVNESNEIKPQMVDQAKLIPLLTKAIQELSEKVNDLQSQIDILKQN